MLTKYVYFIFFTICFPCISACQQNTYNNYLLPETLCCNFAEEIPAGPFYPVSLPLSDKQTVTAACLDIKSLSDNHFLSYEMLAVNSRLPENQRAVINDNVPMLNFKEIEHQVLVGKARNNADIYLIMDNSKKLLYYRGAGTAEQLKQLGFKMENLLAANNLLDDNKRILTENALLNCAINVRDGTQMLIGKNPSGKQAMVVISRKGKLIGYGTGD